MNQKKLMVGAGIAAGLLLAAGLVHLFVLRFQAGDIYPPYSSLRADPLGTKALYESLARCGNLSVSRNYRDISGLDLPEDSTLLFLGDTVSFQPNDEYIPGAIAGQLNAFMRRGGRLIITLRPRTWTPPDVDGEDEDQEPETGNRKQGDEADDRRQTTDKAPDKEDGNKPQNERHRNTAIEDEEDREAIGLTNWLGMAFALVSSPAPATATLDPGMARSGLPLSLRCHTVLCFTNVVPPWKALYTQAGNPVMLERAVGKGSWVVSSLSFFASNEALRDERQPALLSWLIGENRAVIFDETHHGIYESPGVAWLVRKYRLHWLGLGLLVFAGLFVWQNTVSLVPSYQVAVAQGPEIARGKDSTSGLVNILRRNVPWTGVLGVCVGEWRRTLDRTDPETEKSIRRVQAILARETEAPLTQHDPAKAYNEISRNLKDK